MQHPKDIHALSRGDMRPPARPSAWHRMVTAGRLFTAWLGAPARTPGSHSAVTVYQAFILMAASYSIAFSALLGSLVTAFAYNTTDLRPQLLLLGATFYALLPLLRRVGVGLEWEKALFFTTSFTIVFCFGLHDGAIRTAGITTFLPVLVGMGAPLYSRVGIAMLAAVALTISGSLTLIDLARFEPVAGGITRSELGMMGVRNVATIVCATIISLFGRQIYEQLILNVKATRDRARRANEIKGAFLANLSHEVRTPLNAIVGLTEILKRKDDISDQRELLETISRSGHELLTTLNEVLDVAQLEAGQMQIRPGNHGMPEFVGVLERTWRPLIEASDLTFRLDVDPDLPEQLELDAARLRQCINNLMSNAAKFTEAGEVHITIRWHPEPVPMLEIEVCDTGIGIPLEMQPKLMEPFQQAASSDLGRPAGTGLGLYISREIAQMLGGDLTFKSVPGVGTAFTLTARVRRIEDRAPDPAFAAKRALIVDAVATQQMALQCWLTDLGMETTCCVTGENALNLLRSGQFDVVLVDTHLPDFAWEEICRRMRALPGTSNLPIILTLPAGTPARLGVETAMPLVRKPITPRFATPTLRAALQQEAGRAHTCSGH